MSERERFGLRFTDSERDRVIADWIDWQLERGFDVSQRIKDILWETITGQSCLTGRPIAYQGDVQPIRPAPDDPIAKKFLSMGD